jgi:hypothetical protein
LTKQLQYSKLDPSLANSKDNETMVQAGDGRYTVDIRVFIVMIVTAMAVSFGVGVGMGPTASQLFQASLAATAPTADSGLPAVTSVQMEAPLGIPGNADLHEPAGQVSQ